MPLHRIHVATDDGPAERTCGVEGSIVRQRLQQDGNHPPLRCFSLHSRESCNLLRDGQKRGEKGRGKSSPGVIGSLVVLANRVGVTAHVLNHAPRPPKRKKVPPPAKAASPAQTSSADAPTRRMPHGCAELPVHHWRARRWNATLLFPSKIGRAHV